MQSYFSGKYLYGDNFSIEEIENWFKEEAEGYASLGSKNRSEYKYIYHEINDVHGFSKLKSIGSFENVLGFGSAYGHEFEPILHKIKNLTIVEPSDNLVSKRIGEIYPRYLKPEIDGSLLFENESFDLITCFGTLHHIPNVSYVLEEMIRVLKPNGLILMREPICSLGDWNKQRKGLTKNERGIPIEIFEKILAKYNLDILHKAYCFAMTSFFQRIFGFFFNKSLYTSRSYILFDKYLSMALAFNYRYHRRNIIEKCAPSNIFYVIKKANGSAKN